MFQGLKRKSCQTYSGMVPGDGKFGVCRTKQPIEIWCNPLGDWIFGERSYKGLKVSTKRCVSGNLSKGQSRLSWAQDRGSFSLTDLQQPEPTSSEGSCRASSTAMWQWAAKLFLLGCGNRSDPFLDYVSIWDIGRVMGRVTAPRQRYWTFCLSHILLYHGNLSHSFCVEWLNMTIFVHWVCGAILLVITSRMCICEQLKNWIFTTSPNWKLIKGLTPSFHLDGSEIHWIKDKWQKPLEIYIVFIMRRENDHSWERWCQNKAKWKPKLWDKVCP